MAEGLSSRVKIVLKMYYDFVEEMTKLSEAERLELALIVVEGDEVETGLSFEELATAIVQKVNKARSH